MGRLEQDDTRSNHLADRPPSPGWSETGGRETDLQSALVSATSDVRACQKSERSSGEPHEHSLDHGEPDPSLAGSRQPHEALGAGRLGDEFDDQTRLDQRPHQQLAGVAAVGPHQPPPREAPVQLGHDLLGTVPVLDAGRVDHHRQQPPERVDDEVALAPVYLFAGLGAARPPVSVVLTAWLSTIATRGLGSRPAAART